jgi:hypothetical protein
LAIQFRDPRCWQILSLALLLIYGLWVLGFDQSLVGVAAILICALMVQWIGSKGAGIRPYDPLARLSADARRIGQRRAFADALTWSGACSRFAAISRRGSRSNSATGRPVSTVCNTTDERKSSALVVGVKI